jgi:penicillin G amidase
MKALKITLWSILGLIAVVLIAGIIFIRNIQRSALPKMNGEMTLAGLSGNVTVYRDQRGMPHIYANDENDLYFAVGYVMAQERLWQMDLIRRATTGRLSEIFGKDYVQTDLFLRSLDMPDKSKIVIANSDPSILKSAEAYCNGVNKYIKDAGNKLPPEFKILSYKPDPWTPQDMTNIIGYMGWDLASGNLSLDLFCQKLTRKFGQEKAGELIPDWKAVNSYVFPDFKLDEKAMKDAESFIKSMDKLQALGLATFSGSNNWAVTGKRTETGKPVLSNDMHLSLSAPGIWIQMHQVVPGKLNVTGVIVPGQPYVVAGHNEKIAWGMTNLMVDDIDLFEEKINPADSNQYFFNGEWKNMKVREEIIKIKGGSQETYKLRFTHRGPLLAGIQRASGAGLSMRWSGFDASNEIRSVYLLNRAANWDDFLSALSSFRSVSQNFVYADVEGNIGLHTGGGIPIRKGYGTIIRNGQTDEYDWKGYVPFDELPSSYNPANGYVSSANNKTVSDDYPYYISAQFALPYRINRIRTMLNEKEVFSIEDFKRMVTDQHSEYAKLLTPFILKTAGKITDMNPQEKFAYNELKSWDYDMNKDLAAPTVFEFFRSELARNIFSDELGSLYFQLNGMLRDYYIYRILTTGPDEWVDDINTPEKETLDDIFPKSFRSSLVTLSAQAGNDTVKWKWGDIHKITLSHPLGSVNLLNKVFSFNSKTYPVGGSNHTVSPYSYDSKFSVNHGASERHIFNTANWDESLTVIPTGNSGIPASEFYLSETETYLNKQFYKDAFTEAAVKAAAKYTVVLKPGN